MGDIVEAPVAETHVAESVLEEYSFERLGEPELGRVEEHLLVCDYCRARLESIEPINFVHFTEDGPIYSRATRVKSGVVVARHWGRQLDGGSEFKSVSAARVYLNEAFAQMFPDHRCDRRCGPTQEHGKAG